MSSKKTIASWFYAQTEVEGGTYAQVTGPVHTENFRDVYRRCLAVHFASARAANPDAELVLYLNQPWPIEGTHAAREVGRQLDLAGVERRVITYDFAPPASRIAWRNQFFVFDVLRDLSRRCDDDALILILDSDIVWSADTSAGKLWDLLGEVGVLGLEIPYAPDARKNGISRCDLTVLLEKLDGRARVEPIPYLGGEFVALRGDRAAEIVAVVERWWPDLFGEDESQQFPGEEAHLWSAAVAHLGVTGDASPFVKRIWTQALKFRNVTAADLELVLWHVPAEKSYGLARVYRHLVKTGQLPGSLAGMIGIPRNSTRKWCRDVLRALVTRVASGIHRHP